MLSKSYFLFLVLMIVEITVCTQPATVVIGKLQQYRCRSDQ